MALHRVLYFGQVSSNFARGGAPPKWEWWRQYGSVEISGSVAVSSYGKITTTIAIGSCALRATTLATETAPAATTDNNRGLYPPISNDPCLFLCVPIDFSSFFFLEMEMGKQKRRVKLKIKDVEFVLLFLLFRLWVLVVQMEVSMVMVVIWCQNQWQKREEVDASLVTVCLRDEFCVADERFGV